MTSLDTFLAGLSLGVAAGLWLAWCVAAWAFRVLDEAEESE